MRELKKEKIQIKGRKAPEKMSSVAVNKKSTEYCFKKRESDNALGGGGSQPRSKCFLLN